MSSAEAGAVGNCGADYPGQSLLTFPAPPTKRSRHRSLDIVSTQSSGAKQTRTKPSSSASFAVDHNVNNIAVHGASVIADLTSQSGVTTQRASTNSQERFHSSRRASVETVREAGLNNQSDRSSASLRRFDSRMRVLWLGQLAVNGTDICSAELLSRCHIRHTL